MANNTVISRPHSLFVQRRTKMEQDRGGSFKLLRQCLHQGGNQPPQELFINST